MSQTLQCTVTWKHYSIYWHWHWTRYNIIAALDEKLRLQIDFYMVKGIEESNFRRNYQQKMEFFVTYVTFIQFDKKSNMTFY